jgi:nitroreductase
MDRPLPNAATDPLALRYGAGAVPGAVHRNAVLETLLAHRSVRAFLPDPVSAETLQTLVAAAQSAATSSNLQTWSVVAIADQARKDRLAALAGNQRHVSQAPLFLVWLADLARLDAMAQARTSPVDGIHYLEMLLVSLVDATLAAQNAVIALESLGLGAVYIGAIRNHPEQVAAELALPRMVFPVFGLCVGTPDPARPARIKPRLPQAAVLHHEQYAEAPQPAAIAAYVEQLRAFQAAENLTLEDWAERCLARVRTPQSLTGRDRMREALANLGFALR